MRRPMITTACLLRSVAAYKSGSPSCMPNWHKIESNMQFPAINPVAWNKKKTCKIRRSIELSANRQSCHVRYKRATNLLHCVASIEVEIFLHTLQLPPVLEAKPPGLPCWLVFVVLLWLFWKGPMDTMSILEDVKSPCEGLHLFLGTWKTNTDNCNRAMIIATSEPPWIQASVKYLRVFDFDFDSFSPFFFSSSSSPVAFAKASSPRMSGKSARVNFLL